MDEEQQNQEKVWGVVQLFGHNQIAGLISEEVRFGVPMMRVDVPETRNKAAFTTYYHGNSIYNWTPTDEATARAAAEYYKKTPVSAYIMTTQNEPLLTAKVSGDNGRVQVMSDEEYNALCLDDDDEDSF